MVVQKDVLTGLPRVCMKAEMRDERTAAPKALKRVDCLAAQRVERRAALLV